MAATFELIQFAMYDPMICDFTMYDACTLRYAYANDFEMRLVLTT